jgi:hypothetical protein
LSQEGVHQLGRVISEAKDLLNVQLEILEKVLAAEERIATTRIGYLDTYFDTYSKGLDKVANKQSQLGEEFLILSQQADKYLSDKKSDKSKKNDINKNKPPKGSTNVSNSDTPELGEVDVTQLSDAEIKKGIEKKEEALSKLSGWAKKLAEDMQLEQADRDERYAKIKDERAKKEAARKRGEAVAYDEFEVALFKKRNDLYDQFAEKQKTVEQSLIELQNLRTEDAIDQENRITAIRLARTQSSLDAEIKAQDLINNMMAEQAFAQTEEGAAELGNRRANQVAAEDDLASMQKLEEERAKRRADLEYKARKKNNGKLRKEDAAAIEKQLAEEFNIEKGYLKKLSEERFKDEVAERANKNTKIIEDAMSQPLSKENNLMERFKTLRDVARNGEEKATLGNSLLVAAVAISNLAKQLEVKIDEIGSHKGNIDTRLQGSGNEKFMGSYWDQLIRDMTSVGAVNPFFKQEDFAKNIETLVAKGISFDLKQRAFLMTVSDKIASTFDVSNATLLRLVRIQQEDSTAGRLGMESALNAFLNEMYETSEYLSDVAGSVKSSLEEMEALMAGAAATEVEYQVQKWLGSLYSVGMSSDAVSAISNALGQIAAGQIEGLTNGGAGNLLIMAANDAQLSIADILTDGINASDTNKLLQAAVNYLAELSDSASGNKVVQQQLANVFGVKASDLKAATNLVLPGSVSDISNKSMTYDNMMSRLSKMAGSMGSRTSIAEMMTNLWENGQYTLAGSMASNPITYFIYKMATVLDNTAGGIPIPGINIMGNMVELNTSVADLMRVAAVSGGVLGSIGPLISGIANSFSGRAMLNKLGIGNGSGLAVVTRGGAGSEGVGAAGGTTSESGSMAGNSSGSDIKDSTLQESKDSKKQQMIEAKEEEEANQVDALNQTVLQIYELLDSVTSGKSSFKVQVEGYGLTKAGGSGAQGGVQALGGGSGNSALSRGGVNSGGVSGSVDFSGWTSQV